MNIHSALRTLALGLLLAIMPAAAQTTDADSDAHTHTGHPANEEVAPSYAWKLLSPLGLRAEATIDTLLEGYAQEAVPSMVSSAWATTGNLGGEGMNMIFSERPRMSSFFFRDALLAWIPDRSKMRFYNTRIPMTLLSFISAGGRDNAQERLQTTFSGNINAKAQVGAMLDYLYSKGCYENQAVKDLAWGFSGSYIGDRYEFQGYFNHFNMANKENGGITDMLYITDPAELQGGITTINPKSIPTRLNNAHSRQSGDELFLNNRYKVGYWHEEAVDDSTVNRTYIPVSSFIYTLNYTSNKHLFLDSSPSETREFFENTYLNPSLTRDRTTYWSLQNIFGISLLEGFHRYAKFGLAAYINIENRHFQLPADTLDHSQYPDLTPLPEGVSLPASKNQQLIYVGAQLTKQRGSLLTYEANAEVGILGAAIGDATLEGRIRTRFPLLRDSVSIEAFGRFQNDGPSYLMENYISNHFVWQKNLDIQHRLVVGGELQFRPTHTTLTVSASNYKNHVFFGADGIITQNTGSVQILSACLQQNFKVGILHWDNRVTFQKTSNDAVIPLPRLAVYSNLYLLGKIATLNFQLGVDCDYYTSYYAPGFQPALAAFTNQRDMKIGNYPFCNVYANMKLSKTRFYVMMSHVNQGLFGGSNYFSMPYYPLNPRRFQIGISVDFAN